MSKNYTRLEIKEFDRLTRMTSSPDQMRRIKGRLALRKFVDHHGEPKCKEMFAELELRDARRERRQSW